MVARLDKGQLVRYERRRARAGERQHTSEPYGGLATQRRNIQSLSCGRQSAVFLARKRCAVLSFTKYFKTYEVPGMFFRVLRRHQRHLVIALLPEVPPRPGTTWGTSDCTTVFKAKANENLVHDCLFVVVKGLQTFRSSSVSPGRGRGSNCRQTFHSSAECMS